jgi:hypothetical protein
VPSGSPDLSKCISEHEEKAPNLIKEELGFLLAPPPKKNPRIIQFEIGAGLQRVCRQADGELCKCFGVETLQAKKYLRTPAFNFNLCIGGSGSGLSPMFFSYVVKLSPSATKA